LLRLKQNKGAVARLIVQILIALLAIIGPRLNEYIYYQADYGAAYQSPNSKHWLGTDKFGHD
jgi:oligopeptide transport system permease protein